MNPILKILSQKYQSHTLPSPLKLTFDAIECDDLEAFLHQLMPKSSRTNHPDFLQITPNDKNKYVTDDFNELYSFASSAPIQASQKIVLIYNPELISEIINNKILKILEEHHPQCKIILLSQSNQALLPTITSRCISFNLKSHSEQVKESQKIDNFKEFQDFLSQNDKKNNNLSFLLEHYEQNMALGHFQIKSLLNFIRWNQDILPFNPPKGGIEVLMWEIYLKGTSSPH